MNRQLAVVLPMLLALSGCGGGGGGGGGTADAPIDTDASAPRSETPSPLPPGPRPAPPSLPLAPPERPEPLVSLEDDPQRINAIPEIVLVENLADTGLRVGYTSERQRERIDPLYVEAQWRYMQGCIELVAPAPLVVIRVAPLEPLTAADDVLRDIDGRPLASASGGAVPILQVDEAIFDERPGRVRGFELRAIMGRHLWLLAGLSERDYPARCARTEALPDAP